ncbi:MAG: thermonuclease family protein [bacterium]|nr:thermonuclease family protein [bacterium]
MKIRLFFAITAITLCLGVMAVQAAVTRSFTGEVVGVLDGDTIEVMRRGVAVRVRLDGIDCPERKQAFGARTKQFTSKLSFAEKVTVIDKGKDRYGRTIGEVILPDGTSLNKRLVAEGYAWWYSRYSDDEELRNLQAEAREAKKGLWVDPKVIPPWIFRMGGVSPKEDHSVEVLLDRSDVVFLTASGGKYHRDGCRYLSESSFPVTLGEAKGRGYEPCGVCKQ